MQNGGYRIFLGLMHSMPARKCLLTVRTLNTLADKTKRCYFFFPWSWSSDSKCMVYILKKYFRIQLILTNFLQYLILYCILDFLGIDVYLILSFAELGFLLSSLFILARIYLTVSDFSPSYFIDFRTNFWRQCTAQKIFFVSINYLFLLKEHFYISY